MKLNEQIASKMGWERVEHWDKSCEWWGKNGLISEGGFCLPLPNFDSDHNDCFNYVVPFMESEGFAYTVMSLAPEAPVGVSFSHTKGMRYGFGSAQDDSLPRAIVLAALEALKQMEGEDE